MATAAYSFFSQLSGFNPSDGTFTSTDTPISFSINIDEDFTNVDADDTLGVDDGNVDVDGISVSFVYTGYSISGFPIIHEPSGGFYYLFQDGSISSLGPGTATSTPELAICFLSGSLILLGDGTAQAIENLKIGDEVTTVDSELNPVTRPIKFIFKQHHTHPFINKERVYPICFKAGALGDNLPERDLYISPAHAIQIDGHFMRADTLINGVSIYQVDSMPSEFTYYHIELEGHKLLLAEGVPAESFGGLSRKHFDNFDEYMALYGEEPVMENIEPRIKQVDDVPSAVTERLNLRMQNEFSSEASLTKAC